MAAPCASDGEDSDTGVEEDLSRDLNSLRAALAQERDAEGEREGKERSFEWNMWSGLSQTHNQNVRLFHD